ncbi:hypothetical protein ACIQZG_22080 [Lysinibacillus sp. NPDC096418]|uniref:hypothetical protein n=1 Tax=Lysinibacillus sp. NPDC096418 TaxID=3364138 RepID=UPI00380D7796
MWNIVQKKYLYYDTDKLNIKMNKFSKYRKKAILINTDTNITESDKELLKMYYKFYFSLGRVPTPADLDRSDEIYNSDVFLIRFGTMSNIRRLTGVPQIKITKEDLITKEAIKQDLISIYKEFGRVTNRRLKELSEYEISYIYKCFDTRKLNDIWMEIEKELENDKD